MGAESTHVRKLPQFDVPASPGVLLSVSFQWCQLARPLSKGDLGAVHEDHCLLLAIFCIRERTQHGTCIH